MFKLFKNFTLKEKLVILACLILVGANVGLELRIPDYMSKITQLVQTDGSKMSEILTQGAYMVICAFGSLVASIIVGYLAARLSSSFSLSIREKVFNKVQSFDTEEIKKFSTSSLITRTTNDITQIEMFIAMGLQMTFRAPIMAIWAISKIINRSLQWSMLTAGCVVLLLATVISLMIFVLL